MIFAPSTWISIALFVFGLGLMALMYWLEKYPAHDLEPKLLPTTLFLLLGLLIALVTGFHLLQHLVPPPGLN